MNNRIRKSFEEYQQRGLVKMPSCTLYLGDYQDILDMAKELTTFPADILYHSIAIAFSSGIILGLRKGQMDERKRQNKLRKKRAVSR